MDARIAGQIRGIDNTVPRRGTTPAGADARPSTPAPTKPASSGATPTTAQREVFDANSDGVIESWSYALGGDSYETFNPPPSGHIGANARRTSGTQPNAPSSHSTDATVRGASTAAAMHKARGAYRRDGLATVPDARSAPATPTPAAASPAPDTAPQVTQPAPPLVLPSARS
jgi:hypothetical protein